MSGPSTVKEEPIAGRDQLVDYLAEGSKPIEDWRIGTEHEKFGFRLDDLRAPTFEGERGIEALLKGLQQFGWDPVHEGEHVIALLRDGASVSLEPAGQLELSGAPLDTVHATCCEVTSHLKEVKTVADELSWAFSAWASSRNGSARKCRGCPRAATRSCAATCPWSAA